MCVCVQCQEEAEEGDGVEVVAEEAAMMMMMMAALLSLAHSRVSSTSCQTLLKQVCTNCNGSCEFCLPMRQKLIR